MIYKAKYTPKEKEKEVVITLPIYRKLVNTQYKSEQYYAAFPDNSAIKIYYQPGKPDSFIETNKTDYYSVLHSHINLQPINIAEVFATWETIDPDEFWDAHDKTLQRMKVKIPKAELKEGADDVTGVI